MFSSLDNPITAYKKVGVDVQVETASPHKLVVLLFNGARQAVLSAASQMEANDKAAMSKSIVRATEIIANGLRGSLDLKAGGPLAEQLDALYGYMCQRLEAANLNATKATFLEVEHLLAELQSAWEEIGDDPAVVSSNRSTA